MGLTKAEKIELAKSQVKQAESMVEHSRKQMDDWIGTLEIRQEYLEAVTKVSDLVLDGDKPTRTHTKSAITEGDN